MEAVIDVQAEDSYLHHNKTFLDSLSFERILIC